MLATRHFPLKGELATSACLTLAGLSTAQAEAVPADQAMAAKAVGTSFIAASPYIS